MCPPLQRISFNRPPLLFKANVAQYPSPREAREPPWRGQQPHQSAQSNNAIARDISGTNPRAAWHKTGQHPAVSRRPAHPPDSAVQHRSPSVHLNTGVAPSTLPWRSRTRHASHPRPCILDKRIDIEPICHAAGYPRLAKRHQPLNNSRILRQAPKARAARLGQSLEAALRHQPQPDLPG